MDYTTLITPHPPIMWEGSPLPIFPLPIPQAMQCFMNYSVGVAVDLHYATDSHPLLAPLAYAENMRGLVADTLT